MRYLNPKADLTFKKVFGEHPRLVISFLNALLPFETPDEEIESVTYMNPELVPQNPLSKDSIVDVMCKDKLGRLFIVEMQMMWTSAYKQRVLFNASKAYVKQLEVGDYYELLQPVYSLNLVNDTFAEGDRYYHDYRIVEVEETSQVIEGLRFIFVELPKFTPKNYGDKKMHVLWLRYLTEINEKTVEIPKELTANPDINEAITQLRESAFIPAQLLGYEKFWDVVSTAKMHLSSTLRDGFPKGQAMGMKVGMKAGMEIGLKEGERNANLKNARTVKAKGLPLEIIAEITGLCARASASSFLSDT